MSDLSKKIVFWGKTASFCLLVGFVAYTLHQQSTRWADFSESLQQTNWLSGWGLLIPALTPLNWSLEALKWQWLARRIAPLPFTEALGGVLAGLSLSMALPGPLGDTAGRVLSLRAGHRTGAVGAALVAGGMQFYVAVVIGTVAWAAHIWQTPARQTGSGTLLLALLVVLSGLGVVLNFYRPRLINRLGRGRLSRYVAHWQVISHYTHAEMGGAFGLALLRYLTFSIQLYAAFRLFGVPLTTGPLLAGVGVIYLIKTLAPAFNWLSDLGVREAATLWVFAPYELPAPPLLTATLTLWFVNVGLPVLGGLVSLARIRRS